MAKEPSKPIMPEEDIDEAVGRLLEIAREAGRSIASTSGRVSVQSPRKANVDELLRSDLRAALEDEVVPARLPAGGLADHEDSQVVLDSHEVDREIIKKALVGLRLSRLRGIARTQGLGVSGAAEEVATRVARAYHWDSAEIAQLIVANEEEPSPERGTVERIFPLSEAPDLAYVADRLNVVNHRYVRIGVAKWFLFREVKRVDDAVAVRGSYRAYEARLDEEAGEPTLLPVPSAYDTSFTIRNRRNVAIRNGLATTARHAIRAVQVAARIKRRPYVVLPQAAVAKSLDGSSEFLLDLLHTRLRTAGINVDDLTVARFRLTEDADAEQNRPALKAVRFEGRHLLDSVEACRLLVTQKRPLSEIAFLAAYRPTEPNAPTARMPMKVSVENDHVVVATGFGTHPEVSRIAHGRAVDAVQRELEDGVADETRLVALLQRISDRARSNATPTQPTVLLDDGGAD